MKTVVTLGEILVEIMAQKRGQSLRAPGGLTGPFASGAPAIFIDQVARLGQPCGMIGRVGDDDFGWLNVERLRADGVDVSAIEIDPELPTGTAFVTYQEDGGRHFVFNIRHSASGRLSLTAAAEDLLERCDHFHVMGSSLFAPTILAAVRDAVERVKRRGGTISFDPNMRSELAKGSEMAAFFDFALDRSDIVLPSGAEIFLLADAETEEEAAAKLIRRGIGAVVVKRGAEGSVHYDAGSSTRSPAFQVTEKDPTGAGDCFGATYVVCWLRGKSVEESLRYGNLAGANAVTVQGPMEGNAGFAQLDALSASLKG